MHCDKRAHALCIALSEQTKSYGMVSLGFMLLSPLWETEMCVLLTDMSTQLPVSCMELSRYCCFFAA